MSARPKRGINSRGLDADFEAQEIHKSNLILEVQFLRDQQQFDEAAVKSAEAAAIEEQLGDRCEEKGLMDKAWLHRLSAASCWAQAGNIHLAITLADQMLARPELPERLRRHVQEFVQTLRRRRAQWSAAFAGAGTEG